MTITSYSPGDLACNEDLAWSGIDYKTLKDILIKKTLNCVVSSLLQGWEEGVGVSGQYRLHMG